MKWFVCCVKCLDFILKYQLWDLVFGLFEPVASMGHSGTESWAILTPSPNVFPRIASHGSSEDALQALHHPGNSLLISL